MIPLTGKTTKILFFVLCFAIFSFASCSVKSETDDTENELPSFEQYVEEIPLISERVELRSSSLIKHVDIESDFIPEGAALFGKLNSINGYHFIIYTYPADVRLPILEVYDNEGNKINEKQLYRYGSCPVTNSGGSTAIIKDREMIIMQTFCDIYDSKFDSDTIFVHSLIK